MRKISIIGAGHVGLVTGAGFADLGHQVVLADHDRKKIASLKRGEMPFYEPGLEELVHRGVAEGRIRFVTSLKDAVAHGEILFICVGTPQQPNGEADLSAIENVIHEIARALRAYRLIVEKSTVPVETGEWVKRMLRRMVRRGVSFDVASNPEFLQEGQALHNFFHPDRIVLGVGSSKARQLLLELYKPLHAPIITTDMKSAELIKHASNSFLATKISFINTIAQLCDRVGADVMQVAEGMGLDPRIGRAFLDAGVGYGGYCLPKDVSAFIHIAEKHKVSFDLLKAVAHVNVQQRELLVKRAEEALRGLRHKTVGVLGLAFKPNTDDVREAPAVDVIRLLQAGGAKVRVCDPKALAQSNGLLSRVKTCKDLYETARDADCLIVVTEWNEFREVDFARLKKLMRRPLIIDGRNIYEPRDLRRRGFQCVGVGRGDAAH